MAHDCISELMMTSIVIWEAIRIYNSLITYIHIFFIIITHTGSVKLSFVVTCFVYWKDKNGQIYDLKVITVSY